MFAPLPPAYAWLANEPGPQSLLWLLSIHGLREAPGAADNPIILDMARFVGLEKTYHHDSTAWCGLGEAWSQAKAGFEPPKDPLWALNWAKWGNPVDRPMLSDTIVFKRVEDGEIGGHVGKIIGEDDTHYHVLGPNQSDQVCIRRFSKATWTRGMSFGVVAIRRATWRKAQPANIRPIRLRADGAPSSTKVS